MAYPTFASSKAYVNKDNFFKGPQYFGLDDDYLEIKENGTLRLYGTATVWEDLRFPATGINPAGQVSSMVFDTTNIGFTAGPGSTQSIAVIAQMPHSWKVGSTIAPHIHWEPTTTNVGNVVWQLEYKWTSINATEPGAWITDPITVASGGVAFKHLIAPFAHIDGEGQGLSSIISIKISRLGGNGADTYTGDALLKEFDIHYEIDSLGSNLEYIKE